MDGLFTIEHDSRSLRTHEQVPSVATYVDSVVVTECDFRSAAHASAESEAMRAARAKQEAHNDRIVATFNSVSGVEVTELWLLLIHTFSVLFLQLKKLR